MFGYEVVYVREDGIVDRGSSAFSYASPDEALEFFKSVYSGMKVLNLVVTAEWEEIHTPNWRVRRIAERAGYPADEYFNV